MSIVGLLYSIFAGIAFGLAGMAFAKTTHAIVHWSKERIPSAPMRPFVGGVIVALTVFAIGTTKYVGLGIPTIVASFSQHLPPYDFAAKFLFTTVTLGFGFKGGEVTPLFFIGATLGNALSGVVPLPSSLLAGMGFVGVFAGAANTPVASSLMAVELFGAEAGAYAAIACMVSYMFSGHSGIYHAQRVGRSKHHRTVTDEGLSLALIAKSRDQPDFDFLSNLDELGFLKGHRMNELIVLRLYFTASEVHRANSWWKRLAPEPLGPYLLRRAKEAGVEQALLHRVIGGFLKGQNLVMDGGEIPPAKLPQCLELVGPEEILQSFLERNKDQLAGVRSVFLRGEEARIEAAIDMQEIETALDMERNEAP